MVHMYYTDIVDREVHYDMGKGEYTHTTASRITGMPAAKLELSQFVPKCPSNFVGGSASIRVGRELRPAIRYTMTKGKLEYTHTTASRTTGMPAPK